MHRSITQRTDLKNLLLTSPKMEYSIFYKENYKTLKAFGENNFWEVFISAFNDSDRVKRIFNRAPAKEKYWILLPEYGYANNEYPSSGEIFDCSSFNSESDIIISFFKKAISISNSSNLCIDITGFMRPHLIFLIWYLNSLGVKTFDVIYTDPIAYKKAEKTMFTTSAVENVRQIAGCEGNHSTDTTNDVLIIGSGYDHKLITQVAEDKANARKIQLFGFPSLQPDMFQENLINAYAAEESISGEKFLEKHNSLFAPANDPFITAGVLDDFVRSENEKRRITN